MNSEFEAILTEILLEAEAGKAVPETVLLERHPEWREEIQDFLRTRLRLNAVIEPLRIHDDPRFPIPFGSYTLLSELGMGGMGVVYHARSEQHKRDVALKMIRGNQIGTAVERVRFRNEVVAAGRITHPSVVPVFDAGEVRGVPYYTMPLLTGGDLVHRCQSISLTPVEAVAIVQDIARGVDHAHRAGVLHRDLKPSNILFDEEGRPHITDFGLAKLLFGGEDVTRTGQVVGTPGYAAPECLSGGAVTTAADVYGLGSILYFTLTSKPPFDGDSIPLVLDAALHRDPVPPSQLNPAVSRDLDAIVLQALAKQPQKRYPSAGALADDLDCYLAGKPVSARNPTVVERFARTVRRYPLISSLAICLLMLVSLTIFTAWKRYEDTQRFNQELSDALERETQQLDRMRQFDYAGRVNYAADFLQAGRIADACEVLNSLRPRSGEPDLREFAWHHLWRTARSQVRIPIEQSSAISVAISPDERLIASLGVNDFGATLRLHDAESGFVIRESNMGSSLLLNPVFSRLGFLPDSSHVYLWNPSDQEPMAVLRLWDVGRGKWVSELTMPMAMLGGVDPQEDGSLRLFGGSAQDGIGRILRWHPFKGTFQEEHRDPKGIYLFALPAHKGYFLGCVPCQNGDWQELTQVRFVSRSKFTKSEDHFQKAGVFIDADLSPDGRFLALADAFGGWMVWDTRRNTSIHSQNATSLELWGNRLCWFDGGQSLLVSRKNENSRYFMDRLMLKDKTISTLESDYLKVKQMARNASATMQVHACESEICIRRNVPEPNIDLRAHDKEAWSVDFSPDGQLLASSSDDNTAILHDLSSGSVRAVLKGHPSLVTAVAFAPDGKHVYTAGWDGTVRGWNTVTGLEVSRRQAHTQPINRMAISPNGRWLATGGRDKKLVIWDRLKNEVRHTIELDYNRSQTLTFSANSRILTVTCLSELRIYEVESGEPIGSLPFPSDRVPVARRLKSGELVMGNRLGRMTLVGADDQQIYSIPAHTSNILAVAVSPDEQTIATGCMAGKIHLWHRATGRHMVELRAQGPQVNGLAFSPDGRSLVSCDHSGAITLWPGGEP